MNVAVAICTDPGNLQLCYSCLRNPDNRADDAQCGPTLRPQKTANGCKDWTFAPTASRDASHSRL